MPTTPSSMSSLSAVSFSMRVLIFVATRQQDDIRQAHAVHSGDEGHGDSVPHFLDICQVLHHLNQPHDRADDANGRGVTAGAFEDPGLGERLVFVQVDFQLHHVTDFL
jgi:hypothetical protein